jgi:proteasome accessory factor BC
LTHDADKLIRQLSLVAYLMAEQRPVTARDVKNNVEGYANMGDEAFARRYYADRSELQALGVPITSGRDEFTGEELYNLREEQYFLPPIDLTDSELAALTTSFYLLEGQFAYAEPLRLALQNLALGRAHHPVDPGPKTASVELLGTVYTPEVSQRLAKLELAISKQRTVRFTYRSMSGGDRRERTVNPYGLYELRGNWYVVGDDIEPSEDGEPARKTFRVSRISGEITFATRRERDFRTPQDFDVTTYRDRLPWHLEDQTRGTAVLGVGADATWLIRRLYDKGGSEYEEHEDGTATLTTPYSHIAPLVETVLQHMGRLQALEPVELVDQVGEALQRVAALHEGDPSDFEVLPRSEDDQAPPPTRSQGPVAPERFALLQALLAFLLERCGDEASATVRSADILERFHLTQQELEGQLDLLNLVNFGGGCYAVYCWVEGDAIHVDKELYGDTFRRPARLSPLEAKALLRALDVVAPLVAAEAHSSLDTVREKIEAAFGAYSLRDTPAPAPSGGEESAVSVLNEGVRDKRLARIGYLSRSSSEFSERTIEPYLLRRDERGWYVEAWDLSKNGRRTFKVEYVRDAELLDESYEPRTEMDDLSGGLDAAGTATVLFAPNRAERELEQRAGGSPTSDGRALAQVGYGSRDWLLSEVLRYRGDAELLAPAPLREAVREQALALLDEFSGARTR